MIENNGRKKWQRPQLLPLGKLTDIEKNNQISEEMKQQLVALREMLLAESEKKASVVNP